MLHLKMLSPRKLFVAIITVSAAIFSMLVMFRRYGYQTDVISDLWKTGLVTAISTAILGFFFWTLIFKFKTKAQNDLLCGGVSGFLTALCVIPTPAMVWHFKTHYPAENEQGDNETLFLFTELCANSLYAGINTFVLMPKPAIMALILSIFLGMTICLFQSWAHNPIDKK